MQYTASEWAIIWNFMFRLAPIVIPVLIYFGTKKTNSQLGGK